MVTIMKKLLKLNYMALFAVLALFSACTEEDDYTPAQPSAVEETEFFFNREQATSAVLSLSASEYVVVLERVNNEETVTLNLNVNAVDSVFTVPESVTFEAGAKTAEIIIGINENMEAFKEYAVEISLPEEVINPYKMDNYSIFTLKLLKEDYAPFALGVYSSWFFEQSWEAVLEYSPMLDLYRFKDCWVKGDVTFTCNRETMEFEMAAPQFESGYMHPSYGMVTAKVLADNNGFDAETNTFYFAYQWVVSAGSFGAGHDTFTITEVYE